MSLILTRKTNETIHCTTASGEVIIIRLAFIKNMHSARISIDAPETTEILRGELVGQRDDEQFGQKLGCHFNKVR